MTSTTTPSHLGITIDLDQLRDLMRQFMSEVVIDDDDNIYAWPFETFLQWAMRRRREAVADNVLRFRGEKDGDK
jgi:hypothetical protein